MKKLQDKLIEVGNKLATQRHLQSISFGLMAIMPLTIFGSIFQLISALPDIFPFIPSSVSYTHLTLPTICSV